LVGRVELTPDELAVDAVLAADSRAALRRALEKEEKIKKKNKRRPNKFV
jgi:hypothetical protein